MIGHIGAKIELLADMIANINTGGQSHLPTNLKSGDLSRHTERLKRSAEAVISSASTVIGARSTVWGGSERDFTTGSENGQPLSDANRNRIENWIVQPTIEEESTRDTESFIPELPRGPPIFRKPSFGSSPEKTNIEAHSDPEATGGSDSDNDIEFEVIQKFLEKGQEMYDQNSFTEAERFLRRGLKRAQKMSFKKKGLLDLKGIQLKLAMICVQQERLDESERMLSALAKQHAANDRDAACILHASHCLAQVYMCKYNFEAAQDYCQKAVVGRRRILGKQHPDYYGSLNLLAYIYKANGDSISAAVYADLVPLEFSKTNENLIAAGIFRKQKEETVRTLSKGGFNIDAKGFDARKALLWAAEEGHDAVIRLLLERGANIDETDEQGVTAMIEAAWLGKAVAVRKLFAVGAKIEARTKTGHTALIWAAEEGHESVVRLLLEMGANIEAKNDNGETPVWTAANEGHEAVVRILVEKGANIEAENVDGKPPVWIAGNEGHEAVVRLLVEKGAKIEAANVDELTPRSACHQLPLEPRDLPFNIRDPHNTYVEMSKFDNLAMVLRYRAKTHAEHLAYSVLDQKGKETMSITWKKLASRAEKVAQAIRDKSALYKGDRVGMIYAQTEIVEFAVALMGCFIAGVVAVPINDLENYGRLNILLTSTQTHLVLTTAANLKNLQRDITVAKQYWPRGVEWWKTNEFGDYNAKGEEPPLADADLAYIEFSATQPGTMRGVVMSHRTIMHQMATLSAVVHSATSDFIDKQDRSGAGNHHEEIILSYLDPRRRIGMILGVLLDVYGGHTTVWVEKRAVATPGLYAYLITKYKASLMVTDYPGLKTAAYDYTTDPIATMDFKRNLEPNFAGVKLCLIDTLIVDAEFNEVLAENWLRPLRNPRAREVVAPMLCLPEHGGMVISVRDWLGGEERMGCPLSHEMENKGTRPKAVYGSSLVGGDNTSRSELGEVLLDKRALQKNNVVVLAMGSQAVAAAGTIPDAVRCAAFGYPMTDTTLAVVDPETCVLCDPNTLGEIWVDSPSLSGGFWALPKATETIFHARAYVSKEGTPTPTEIDGEFLRTGLRGCVIKGKIFILGRIESTPTTAVGSASNPASASALPSTSVSTERYGDPDNSPSSEAGNPFVTFE